MTVKARLEANQKHGILEDSVANRLMVSDTIRKYLVKSGVRPSHILHIAPIAEELYFIPSASQILQSRIRASNAKEDQLRLTEGWIGQPQGFWESVEYIFNIHIPWTRRRAPRSGGSTK